MWASSKWRKTRSRGELSEQRHRSPGAERATAGPTHTRCKVKRREAGDMGAALESDRALEMLIDVIENGVHPTIVFRNGLSRHCRSTLH